MRARTKARFAWSSLVCLGMRGTIGKVDNPPAAMGSLPERGPRGRQAAFIDPATNRGVLLEITAET